MFREEASKEKLGFESHWDSAVGVEVDAARGKSGNREDDVVDGCGSFPSLAAGKVAGGESSGEGSMAGASGRERERRREGIDKVEPAIQYRRR